MLTSKLKKLFNNFQKTLRPQRPKPDENRRLINPIRLWLLLVSLLAAVAAYSAYNIRQLSHGAQKKILESQLEILIKSQFTTLEARNFRGFIEGLGKDFTNSYLEINSATATNSTQWATGSHPFDGPDQKKFQAGSAAKTDICVERTITTQFMPTTLKLCRPNQSPTTALTLTATLFIFISFVVLVITRKTESETVTSLKKFLGEFNVAIKPNSNLVDILNTAKNLQSEVEKSHELKIEAEKLKALNLMAKQVAHDIRSPLSALNAVAGISKNINLEEKDLLQNAAQRINEIAEDLLAANPSNANEPNSTIGQFQKHEPETANFLASLVEEKRVEHVNRSIHFETSDSNIEKTLLPFSKNLKRILSNLINNSVAATKPQDKIRIFVTQNRETLTISVEDSGMGFSTQQIEKLLHGPAPAPTNNKGYGLYHARSFAESLGGSLNISSQENRGTTVELRLPPIGLTS